ncbi:hypothetical protein [Tropicimonas sp. IMCC34043]|uniref:hypothetical protein n=1 Tax=Tropicimonas sp. IMCC34043 TaxID=2248760 RepID=UPI000E252187|nr:hypothetical protein [Tropicimonas sp. IMCC34043]
MFLELIAAVVAGIMTAGIVMGLSRLSGGRLPRWLTPVAAGLGMIFVAMVLEYTWFERTKADLPETFVVTATHGLRQAWRPWTYGYPIVDRFVAVDAGSVRRHPGAPGLRIADLLAFGRWAPVRKVTMIWDCEGRRVAPLVETVTLEESGAVTGAVWVPLAEDDTAAEALCKEEQ